MPDPDSMDSTEFTYYVARHGVRKDWSKRSTGELIEDVNVLHRFMRQLVRDKDHMRETIRRQRDWNRIVTAAVVALIGVVGWMFQDCVQARMRAAAPQRIETPAALSN